MLFQTHSNTPFRMFLLLTVPVGFVHAAMRFNFENCYSVGKSATIAVSAAGNLPEIWTYRVRFPSDAISTDWGEWMEDGVTSPLTVTALKPGNYTITVYFMDNGSYKPQVLAYRTVDVTITT